MDLHSYYRLYPQLRKRAWQDCYEATELMRIFVARANPESSKFYGIDFPAGSLLILPRDLYESMNMHPLVYDQAMRRLIDEGDITVTEYNYNRIITLTHYPSNEVREQYIAPTQPEHSPTTPTQFSTDEVGAQYIAAAQPALTENDAPHSIMPHARTLLIASAPPAHLKKHTTTSHQPPHSNTLSQHYPEKQKNTFLPHAPPHGQRPCKKPHSSDICIKAGVNPLEYWKNFLSIQHPCPARPYPTAKAHIDIVGNNHPAPATKRPGPIGARPRKAYLEAITS